jgi:hypothetical protein
MSEEGAGAMPKTGWQAESLRLTVFPEETEIASATQWWEKLTGQPPEARNEKPREGRLQDAGDHEENKLILALQPGRIDWQLAGDLQAETGPDDWLTVGAIPAVLHGFAELMERWFQFEERPTINRIALGAVLVQPVVSLEEGYGRIATYLPFEFMSEGASDLIFRINRPRPSKTGVEELNINRLCTWSVAARRGIQLGLDVASGVQTTAITDQQLACRAELDINTAPDSLGKLPQDRLLDILKEMVDLGVEIADEGDTK